MELKPDDYEVGIHVTGCRGPQRTRTHFENGGTVTVDHYEDTSYQGDILIIEAINLPFIAVRDLRYSFMGKPKISSIDTRKFGFCRLSAEYVSIFLQEETDETA